MGKTVLDKLKEVKKNNDTALVSFFNTGEIKKDTYSQASRLKEASIKSNYDLISEVYERAANSYNTFNYDYDTINMYLELGLIYDNDNINSNNQIKEGANPVKDIVRLYTGSIKSYKDGEQTNKADYGEYGLGKQGFIKFSNLIKWIDNNDLIYIGPETFEEFKNRILSGEKFDIVLSANLTKENLLDNNKNIVK